MCLKWHAFPTPLLKVRWRLDDGHNTTRCLMVTALPCAVQHKMYCVVILSAAFDLPWNMKFFMENNQMHHPASRSGSVKFLIRAKYSFCIHPV